MKRTIKVLVLILLILIAAGTGGIMFLASGLEDGEAITVMDVQTDSLSDGEFVGTYENKRWDNKVKVKIESGTITEIKVVDTVMFEKPEVTEALISQVLYKQSLEIDGVTGATVTVNAYLKAIENALMKARQ
ncbi:MAG: FMN-binding protein [Clostridiales bacterium]|nr:FMN-binding protein [Clostridiales bacterium]